VNPAGGSVVYASWNGETQVASWTVLAGGTASTLAKAGVQRYINFETAITVRADGPYFAVTANDAHGHVLAQSQTVKRQK
jgi:nitrite reductase/ring-hydroxylating ferredoxin subunit